VTGTANPKAALVLSGKGGVGKTLISVNLALHLKDTGAKVGLLDADFSASNSGYFLDLKGKEMGFGREEFRPLDYDGLEVFGISLIMGDRGVNMAGDQYAQLLRDSVEATPWAAEYVVVDCPAGYGDELTTAAIVFQETLLGSVIVVQPAHHLDARRALQIHRDKELPILGLIENMTYYEGPGGDRVAIFGESVVEELGAEFKVPVFGKIPLSMNIRRQVEMRNPKLTGEYAEPILNAVKAITQARPTKPGFIEKGLGWLREKVDKVLIEMVLSINRELNIPGLQQQHGYPGGSIVRLNVMSDDMTRIVTQADWVVHEGKLTAADGSYNPDSQIDIKPKAVKWAFLGNRVMSNGEIYTFKDAQALGDMRVYGEKSMARGAYFIKVVFDELSRNRAAMDKMRPLFEAL